MKRMERIFSVPLKGGAVTDVYSADSLAELHESLRAMGSSMLFIADDNTERFLPERAERIILPHGERWKNWESVDRILSAALSSGLARDSVFVGVGGGVILDMAAFAASIYMRGARAVLVPTTLLAMVDATLGGKTGIDYGGGKNLVGTFFPAESVLILPDVLETLPEKEDRCGLGEVVKHAFLSSDRRLYDFLSDNRGSVLGRDSSVMDEMIRLSLEVKIDYITRDPEERKGIRSALNLGHTFSHALEAAEDFSISHGEGVAWGTAAAFRVGKDKGITAPDYADEAIRLIEDYGFDTSFRLPENLFPSFMEAVAKDKKKKGGSVKFVLMEGQGRPVLMALDETSVRKSVLS